jgi:uridine kinase
MKKTVWILRGCSGGGKSFVTEKLNKTIGWVAVSADDYFTDKDGNYNWNANELGQAHEACKNSFKEALRESTVTDIIVNNTNTKEREWKFYQQEALKFGSDVIFLVVENRHGGENIHSVPQEHVKVQEERIKNNLKLI